MFIYQSRCVYVRAKINLVLKTVTQDPFQTSKETHAASTKAPDALQTESQTTAVT